MFMYDDPTRMPDALIDTSLVGLLADAGAAACIDVLQGTITTSTPEDPWRFLGVPTGADPSSILLDWVHPEDRESLQFTLDNVARSGSPETSRIRFSTSTQTQSSMLACVLVVPGKAIDSFRLYIIPQRDGNALDPEILRRHRLCNVGTLASGVAHDLNNLLTGILAVTDAIHESTEEPSVTKQLMLLENTVDRATELTDGLLMFIKDAPFDTPAIDPLGCIAEIEKLVSATLDEQVTMTLQFDKESHPVNISRSHLGQVFLNLIINARDALESNTGTIDVRATFHPADNPTTFILSVADSGPGLTPSECKKVFRPFYTTKGPIQGTGLGLSIVKAIVADAEGDIRVQSELGRGTLFQVILPVSQNIEE
ncbi:hypothetical protein SCG7086_BU_00040 [Chlamydiales bacterium SCGC AG-110-P3]|nr:hypothetical protein SCG7086_BU_00040 [Chlamydiales bacterium SCGC AG-110-P3]